MSIYQKLSHPLALAIFLLTLLLPVFIGLATRRRNRCQTDFFLGGRTLGKFAIALSAVASGRSSWLVLGVSGMAYARGVGAVWAVAGYIMAEMIQFIYIGIRLRRLSERYSAITLLDFFEEHFQDKKRRIRLVGAVIMTVFLLAYVAAQFNAGAAALAAAFAPKLTLPVALLISAGLVLIYMILGGYMAVVYNDVVRAVIMFIGLVIFPFVIVSKTGGMSTLLQMLRQLDPSLVDPLSLGFGALIGFLGIGLGSPGQPHVIVRYMTINRVDQLRFAAVIGTFWNVVMAWGAVIIGLAGRVAIPSIASLPDQNPEMIYLVISAREFGPILYGLLIGGIFAAILSTADSQLLVVSSTVICDIVEKLAGRGRAISEEVKLRWSRWVVLISGLVSVILAYLAQDLIFWLVLFAWGGLGASFGTTLIMALYWKRTTIAGIVAGMITGTVVTVVWKLWLVKPTGLYELIPAFFLALLSIVIVSRLTGSRAPERS